MAQKPPLAIGVGKKLLSRDVQKEERSKVFEEIIDTKNFE